MSSFTSYPANVRSGRKLPIAADKAALPQSPKVGRLGCGLELPIAALDR
jgi:hypothetical protein